MQDAGFQIEKSRGMLFTYASIRTYCHRKELQHSPAGHCCKDSMKALITGAGSGIGKQIALCLAEDSYDIIAVGRDEDRLRQTALEIPTKTAVIRADLAKQKECFDLFQMVKDEDIEIVVNNAGFGVFGPFSETDLGAELSMLDVNIEALHIFTKLFVKQFMEQDHGYILNVASAAAFLPGPLFASYYASKAYVMRLTTAVREEIRRAHKDVYLGAVFPGPVATAFNDRAGVAHSLPGKTPAEVARYAVKKMYAKKAIIVPGFLMKLLRVGAKLVPEPISVRIAWYAQRRKLGEHPYY